MTFDLTSWLSARRRTVSADRRSLPARRPLSFESLEQRQLLSGTPFTYTAINADALGLLPLSSNGEFQLIDNTKNQVLAETNQNDFTSIVINGYSGGGQLLTVVENNNGVFNIPITFNDGQVANAANNKLIVDASAFPNAGQSYTVTSTAVDFGATPINYSPYTQGGVTLNIGTGAVGTVTVDSTLGSVPVTINSGGGGDKYFIGGSTTGNLTNIAGPLTLDSASNDSLSFLDNGDASPGSYQLTSTGLVFNGVKLKYASAASITVSMGTYGGTAIDVSALPAATTYFGWAPNGARQSLIVNSGPLDESVGLVIDASSMVPAGQGDLLTVDDSTGTVPQALYTVTSSTVQMGEFGGSHAPNTLVKYSPNVTGGLVINTGAGPGDIQAYINSTATTVPVAINTSSATYTSLYVGGYLAGNMSAIAGPLTLKTHEQDAIIFNDNSNPAAATYQFMSTYLLYDGKTIIGYTNPGAFLVETSTHAGDAVILKSLPAATGTFFFSPTGTGAALLVSSAPLAMPGLTVDAYSEVPTGSKALVTVDDSSDPNSNVAYTIAGGAVAVQGGAQVLYGPGDSGGVVLNTGTGRNNTVNVTSTLANVQLAINTNSPPSGTQIFVGSPNAPGGLSQVAGPLFLNTKVGDTVVLNDQANSNATSYTITSTYLAAGSQVIGYAQMTNLTLYSSSGKDTITAQSLPSQLANFSLLMSNSSANPGSTATFEAGAVTRSLQRSVTVSDSVGSGDLLSVNDSIDTAANTLYNLATSVVSVAELFIQTLNTSNYTLFNYSDNLQGISLLTGTGAGDAAWISATAVPLTLVTSASGSVAIAVGSNGGSGGTLSNIAAGLNIESNSLNDHLTFNDSSNTIGTTYVIQGSSLQRGSLVITFSARIFTVLTGTGTNSETVENLPAGDILNLTINSTDTYTKLGSALGTVNLTVR